jgi:glycosyltransferase involved in cell wall biosynthesis
MEIYISSLGRPDKQVTLKYLPKRWRDSTKIVVVPEEEDLYKKWDVDLLVLPKDIEKGLSANRQFLLENSTGPFVCFLDDDLDFHVRTEGIKLKKCSPRDVGKLLDLWVEWLEEGLAIVGVSPRGGNNHVLEEYEECTRLMSGYAFNRDILLENKVRFDAVILRQDFHVVLSLLELGYPNRVSYSYAHGQSSGSGSSGGCAAYRTSDLMKSEAFKLQKLHPGVVMPVVKKSKTGWKDMDKTSDGMMERWDVRISWKKALRTKRNDSSGILDFIK